MGKQVIFPAAGLRNGKLRALPDRLHVLALVALVALAATTAGAAQPSCGECSDLGKYLQKIKDLELIRDTYKKYIPGEPNYAGPVRTTEDLEAFVRADICAAVGGCVSSASEGGTELRAELTTTVPDCVIRVNDAPLDAKTDAAYRATTCTPFADAALAHERVHKANCEFTKKGGWLQDFDDPAENAADEVSAYNLQIKMMRQSMRKLVPRCGWQPSPGQKRDPSSIPTEKQLDGMRARGWRAAKALAGGKK